MKLRSEHIISAAIIVLLLAFAFTRSEGRQGAASARAPLSILFLMDSSASMLKTDPQALRKAAAQAVIALLAPDDEVAIVEFDAEGREISSWIAARERAQLFRFVDRIGDSGSHTDMRAGLQISLGLFESVAQNRRKVIFLLSDGDLDPYPRDPVYAPDHLSFAVDMARLSGEAERQMRLEYKNRLAPRARRMIFSEQMPELRRREIEIFTIALGSAAGRGTEAEQLLSQLASETSRHPTEVHHFHAADAPDLLDVFTRLLAYMTDLTIYRQESSEIVAGNMASMELDTLALAPRLFVVAGSESEFALQTGDGSVVSPEAGTHRNLRLYTLDGQALPVAYRYGFTGGQGRYGILWAGGSALQVELTGLAPEYQFGQTVKARAVVRARDGSVDSSLFTVKSVEAVLTPSDPARRQEAVRLELKREGSSYPLEYRPEAAGDLQMQIFVRAVDAQGRDVLPRPSLVHQFRVLPRFYVTPEMIDFGTAGGGREIEREIEIHCGLSAPVDVAIDGRVKMSSSSSYSDAAGSDVPAIAASKFNLAPGEIVKRAIRLQLPAGTAYGDYEGEIVVRASNGEQDVIAFRVHVPSFWESFRVPLILIPILLAALLVYLGYIWGILGSPRGVLRVVEGPPGNLEPTIRLSRVRRGLLARWFNFRRHRLPLEELRLPSWEKNLEIELVFWRFGPVYLRNLGDPKTGGAVQIEGKRPGARPIKRGPGEKHRLVDGETIIAGKYKLQYKNR